MKILTIALLLVAFVFTANSQTKTEAERELEVKSLIQKFNAKYFVDGKTAFVQKRDADAVKIFNNLLLVEPENGVAYFYRGRAFVNQNMYDRAMLDYKSALKTSYQNPEIYFLIAKLEKFVGRNAEALTAFNEYLKLKPTQMNDREIRWTRGRAALLSGQNQTCIEDFTFALSLNANDGAAFVNRAICQMEAGNRDAAGKDFSTALKLNINFKDNFYYRVFQDKKPECKGTAKDWDFGFNTLYTNESDFKAFAQTYYGTKCFPSDPLLYRDKLEILTKYSNGYAEEALQSYQTYLKFFGSDYYVNPLKVKLMNQTGNKFLSERADRPTIYKTAAEYVKQGNSIDLSDLYAVVEAANYALAIEPNNADALLLRARAFAVGNPMFAPLAWRDASNALKINAKLSLAYNVRGLVLKSEKNYAEAINEFNRALSVNTNEDRAYANLGAIYDLQKNHDSALQNFNRALQISPNNIAWLTLRGNSQFNAGNFPQAIADFQRVIQIDDKSLEIRLKTIQAYEKIGETNAANREVFGLLQRFPDESRAKELAIRYPNASANNLVLKGSMRDAETMLFRLETNRLVEENNSLMSRIESAIDYYNKTQSKTDQLENRQQHIRTFEIVEGHADKVIENSRSIMTKANNFLTKYKPDKDVSQEIVQLAKSRIADSVKLIQYMQTRQDNWSTERKQLQGIK